MICSQRSQLTYGVGGAPVTKRESFCINVGAAAVIDIRLRVVVRCGVVHAAEDGFGVAATLL